jgi:triphosphatase
MRPADQCVRAPTAPPRLINSKAVGYGTRPDFANTDVAAGSSTPFRSGPQRSALAPYSDQTEDIDTAAWIETGDWTNNNDELVRPLRDQPVATAAAAEMNRRYRKILKRGARLVGLDPVHRHSIRIEAKKLRYACQFFGDTFHGKKAVRRRKELLAASERLQDTLGDLNDISVHERLTERLGVVSETGGKRKQRSPNKAFAAGRLSGREAARMASVLEDAVRAYAGFAKAKPFWR